MKLKHLISILTLVIILASCSLQKQDVHYRGLVRTGSSNYTFDTVSYSDMARDFPIKGSVYQQQHKWAESVLEFQEGLRYSDEPAIYYAMGRSYRELQKYHLALESGNKALDRDSAFIPAVELLTELYIIQSQISDALRAYEYLAELEPTFQRRYRLARLCELDEKYDRAVEIYNSLLKGRNNDIDLHMRLSDIYSRTGRDSLRIMHLEEIYRIDNDNSRYVTNLLQAYLHEGNYSKLSILMDKLDSTFTTARIISFYSATAAWMIEDSSSAAAEAIPGFLDRIDNRFYFEWRINLFSMYLADIVSDTVRVNRFAEQALKAPDSIPDISLQVAMFYLQKEDFGKSMSVLNRFEPQFPSDYNFPLMKSFILTSTDDDREALNQLYRANQLDSNNMQILAQFGILYDKLDMADSSLMAYERALELAPENALVNNNYAFSLAEAGRDLDKALLLSMKSLQYDPLNPSYLDTYGWLQYLSGNYDIALEYIQKAIAQGDPSSEVYYHLGEIYLEMGEKAKAIEAFTKALEINPDDNNIEVRLKQLVD